MNTVRTAATKDRLPSRPLTGVLRIPWFAAALLCACAHAQSPGPEALPAALPRPATPGQVLTGDGYGVNVPPGATVEIMLPALCLDFSKGTPTADARFSVDARNASDEVRSLLALHDEMLKNEAAYRAMVSAIPSLAILGKDPHPYVTQGGHEGELATPFAEALDEALQYAVWRNDESFFTSHQIGRQQLRTKVDEEKEILRAIEQESFDSKLLSDELLVAVAMLKRTGQWEEKKAEFVRQAEIGIAEAEIRLQRVDACVGLSKVMLQIASGRQPEAAR